MKFKKYLTEAVGIDVVKKALIGKPIWDYKNTLVDEFDGKYRKIIGNIEPDESFLEEHKLFLDLENYFTFRKYVLTKHSYIKGFVTKDKQQYKIGKLLRKWYQEDKDEDLLNYLEAFRDDPLRKSNRKPYLVVVSKHPYDVLGASTDRHWSSCTNLGNSIIYTKKTEDEKRKGSQADELVQSLNNPYLVAYLVDPDDSNSQGKIMIQHPLARILIYPFKHEDGRYNWSIGGVHGNNNDLFTEIVKDWVINLNSKFKEDEDEDEIFFRIVGAFYDSYDEDLVQSWVPPEKTFKKTNENMKNIDMGSMELAFEGANQYYLIYDLKLKDFIEKNIMESPLVEDTEFYNDYFEYIIRALLIQSPISLVFSDIDDFGIFRIWDDGTVHLGTIKLRGINENLVHEMDSIEELVEEYGPYFFITLALEKISEFDRMFGYYKNLVDSNLEVFFRNLTKSVGDKLLEIGVDPDVSNWKKLNREDMFEIVENLASNFRME